MDEPLKCHFCGADAIGIFSHQRAPISLAVCDEHFDKLGERYWESPPKRPPFVLHNGETPARIHGVKPHAPDLPPAALPR